MIIIMKNNFSEKDLNEINLRLNESGLKGQKIEGTRGRCHRCGVISRERKGNGIEVIAEA